MLRRSRETARAGLEPRQHSAFASAHFGLHRYQMSALLKIADLTVAYGGIQAVKGISLEVHPGEMVALVGTNGAGKTTTLKAIAGMLSAPRDSIQFEGRAVGGMASHELARAGLALVPEGRGIFPKLTVAENLAMGAYLRNPAKADQELTRVFTLFPRLRDRVSQTGGTLSGGEQQMLAIGRALMAAPKLLLLDEPGMGLAPLIAKQIFETIRQIASSGVTILLVEQNARKALQLTQRAYVIESGLITLSGSSCDLLANPAVRAAYFGEIETGES